MCIVCALWEQKKITAKEADKAFEELVEQDSSGEFMWHIVESLNRIKEEDSNGTP